MNLSQSIDHAVKAYLNHTQTIINGDGALNASILIGPFNEITQTAQQVALQALSAQGNGSIDPQLLQNGQAGQATENGEGEGDGKKKRKKRAYKKRDPDAPKRPLTAYFRYLGEVRPKIMEEVKANPGKFEEAGKPGDISKIATKRWNLLTAEQQEPYKKAYRDGLQEYEEKVKEYKLRTGQEVEDSKGDHDATEMGPDGDAEGGGEEEDEEEDEDDQPQQVQNKASAGGKDDDSDESSSSDSDAEGESDEEVPAKAAPQPKKAAPTPKSAMKKGGKQAQTFSSVPESPAKEASPAKKRKAAAEPEESAKSSKKKSRKSTVTAGADPVPSPAPAAAESSPPATEKSSKKSKKDKKKRRSSVEA